MSEKSSFFYFKLKFKKLFKTLSGIYRAGYFKYAMIIYAIVMAPMIYVSASRYKSEDFYDDIDMEEMLPMVKALKVSRRDFKDTLSVMGTVKGTSEVELKFEIEGRVHSFNFREGDSVSEGEVIVSLDSDDVMTKLEHAKAKLNSVKSQYLNAREQYETHKELYEMGAIIRSKLREVELNMQGYEAEMRAARAEVRMAQAQLDKTVITAPSDGVMGTRFVQPGDFVTPHDEVGSFLQVDDVFVEAGIIEREIQKIKQGQMVEITFDAYPDRVFQGVVDNIARMVRGETRTLPIEIRIDNPDSSIYSGMLADCEIILDEMEDVLMVPSDSIIDLGEMEVVPVVKMESDEVGVVELRKIQPGRMRPDYTEIEEGLDPGEMIVQETQQPLSDGLRVRVTDVSESPGG